MAWDCTKYFDYLFDRTPHFDEDLLQDWFPTDDAWIGQVMTSDWNAFTGTTHTYDRLHIGVPDMSQAWTKFDAQSEDCIACSPDEIAIGWGSTRKTYDRYRQSYTTNVLCFDQIDTRAKAKEQMAQIIKGLKNITKMVQSDYLRTASALFNDKLYIAGSSLTEVTITNSTFTGQLLTIDLGGAGNVPSSELTIQYLQRFYEPLQFEGYFKSKYVPNGMFKLITDPITSQRLCQNNPSLTAHFRYQDFQKGGELFKYGMSSAIGNYGIAWDAFPARFYHTSAGVLRRVWPYVPTAATIGEKPLVAVEYLKAPYQLSQIWHPEAMRRLVPKLESVHPEMPFLTRDLAGKWTFVGGNRDSVIIHKDPITGETCTIDNKRGKQGLFLADFENAIKFERPELTRCILHQREPGCVVDSPACSTPPAYVIQDFTTNNTVCPTL